MTPPLKNPGYAPELCYLPRAMVMLMSEFVPDVITRPWFMYVELITLAMFYLKHVIN